MKVVTAKYLDDYKIEIIFDDKKRNVLYFKGIDFYKYQSYEAMSIMKPNFSEHKKEELF